MTGTALLTAPARPITTRAVVSSAPRRTSVAPVMRVHTYPFVEPAGLAGWRAASVERAVTARIRPAQARAVLTAMRAGMTRDVAATGAHLSPVQALDVVAGVGARMGQANKSGTRAHTCMSASRGARAGLTPGAHTVDGLSVVVLAEGWARTRLEPRDVSRSYAAVVLADAAGDAAAVRHWLETTTGQIPVTYQHLAHLYSVANGTFTTLDGITENAEVQGAYLRAFDLLAASIRHAHQELAVLLAPQTTPARALEAARGCFWLLGAFARPVGACATAAAAGNVEARRALKVAVDRLRAGVEREPRRYFPKGIGDLSSAQFRAVCARAGHPMTQDDDGSREEKGQSNLTAALLATWKASGATLAQVDSLTAARTGRA